MSETNFNNKVKTQTLHLLALATVTIFCLVYYLHQGGSVFIYVCMFDLSVNKITQKLLIKSL